MTNQSWVISDFSDFAVLPSPGTIVFESSERGWPLQEILKDLYQPKGARLTKNPSCSRPVLRALSVATAVSGDARSLERWAYGYTTILSTWTCPAVFFTSSIAWRTTPCKSSSSIDSTAQKTVSTSVSLSERTEHSSAIFVFFFASYSM